MRTRPNGMSYRGGKHNTLLGCGLAEMCMVAQSRGVTPLRPCHSSVELRRANRRNGNAPTCHIPALNLAAALHRACGDAASPKAGPATKHWEPQTGHHQLRLAGAQSRRLKLLDLESMVIGSKASTVLCLFITCAGTQTVKRIDAHPRGISRSFSYIRAAASFN